MQIFRKLKVSRPVIFLALGIIFVLPVFLDFNYITAPHIQGIKYKFTEKECIANKICIRHYHYTANGSLDDVTNNLVHYLQTQRYDAQTLKYSDENYWVVTAEKKDPRYLHPASLNSTITTGKISGTVDITITSQQARCELPKSTVDDCHTNGD